MKSDEILMEIAIGKSIIRKLPSYIKNTQSECKKTVAEELLFETSE
ncbi:MAG: hypothetical protein J7K00_04700 [Candidatus Diapherotrites archaeon]|nr:hypothetical protein [Candidatus Diapherotrites archaeon]